MSDAPPVITIDGPGGAGKGTASYLLARRNGWHLLDSGAIYRIYALAALKQGVDLDDEIALRTLGATMDVQFRLTDTGVEVWLDDERVDTDLRTEQTGMAAARVAALPVVRTTLFQLQRAFRRPPGLVADGRDMGTVVFPDAPCKIYLTASVEERARRRFLQLRQQGRDVTIPDLVREIEARDERDMNRSVAPLKPAPEALILDTTGLDIEAVLRAIVTHARDCGLDVTCETSESPRSTSPAGR